MTDLTENKRPTGRIFLTLQKGGRLHCIAVSPTFFFLLVALAGLLLAASLAQTALTLLRTNAQPALVEDAPVASLRIARLQTEVERLTSREAITSDLLQRSIQDLEARQAELEAQALTLESVGAAPPAPATDDNGEHPPVRLKKLEGAVNRLSEAQTDALASHAARKRSEAEALMAAFRYAGIEAAPRSAPLGVGGPFIPLNDGYHGQRFAAVLREAEPALAWHKRLTERLKTAPLRSPLPGPSETSSGFGARMDPFHGRMAWHAGVDLRTESGADVVATAGGTVTQAGWNGAYGLMVEIDHGEGYATRYGHLSKVLVREGQSVAASAKIARAGTTGRTTGAHLHYEVRIKDEAVDPSRYLRAGEMIAKLHAAHSRGRDLAQLTGSQPKL